MANEFIIRKGYKSLSSSEITGSLNVSADTYTNDVFIDGHGSVSASLSSIVANDLDGSGTANYISKFSDTDTLTDSSISDDGSTVNIFANSTGNTGVVSIYGEGGVPPTLLVSSRTNRAKLKIADNDTAINIIAEGSVGSFGFGSTSSATNNISILSTGRVGIGVIASTNAMLDVRGPDTDNAVLGRFWSNTGARGSFIIRNGTNVSPTTFIGTAGGSEQLSIGTNNTEAIRIDASQKVGIGTVSPLHPLHVVGIISGSDTYINGWNSVSGSLSTITTTHTDFSASVSTRFEGLTTDYTELDNIPDNIISSSAQVDHDQTTNFVAGEHFLQSAITTVGTVTTGNVNAILPTNTVSSSAQIASDISGSITSFSGSIAGRVETNENSIASLNGATGSYLLNTTDTLTGNLTVTGTLTAQEFHTEFVSASILFDSGSTKFGDSSDDKHSFTGSLEVSGSGITIKDPSTPTINLIDQTNDLSLKFRAANNYGYIDLDQGNTVGSSRLLLRTDGYPFLYGNQNHDVYIPSGSLTIGTGSTTGNFNSYISATRQLTHNGNGGDLSIISDNNSAPVLFVKGTGTADLVNIYDNTTEVFTILDGGNVGIGTTSPGEKLQVDGAVKFGQNSNIPEAAISHYTNGYLYIKGGSSGLAIGNNDYNANIYLTNGDAVQISTSGSDRMIVNSSGNVGIGTTSPDSKLHVESSSATGANFILETTHTGGIPLLDLKGAHSAQLRYKDELDVIQGRVDFGDSGTFNFIDVPNNSSTLYLKTGGNVGIGTTSPESKLHIDSTGEALRFTRSSQETYRVIHGTSGLYFTGPNTASLILGITQNSDVDIFNTSGSVMFRADGSTGNVGIGTTSPGSRLTVSGTNNTTSEITLINTNPSTDNDWSITPFYNDQTLRFRTNSATTTVMTLEDNGNVGIGTTSPQSKLHLATTGGSTLTIQNTTNSGNAALNFRDEGGNDQFQVYYALGANRSYNLVNGNGLTIYSSQSSSEIARFGNASNGYTDSYFTGKVGIGTTSPGAILHVKGSTDSTEVIIDTDDNAIGDSAFIKFNGARAQVGWIDAAVTLTDGGGNKDIKLKVNTGSIFLQTNNTNRLTVATGGNVGIGTTSPDQKLQVVGNGTGNSGIGFKQSGAQEHRLYAAAQIQNNAIGSSAPVWKWGQSDATGSISSQKMLLNNSGLTVAGDIDSDDITIDGWGSVSGSLASIATAGGVNGSGTTNDIVMWSSANSLTDAPIAISGNNATFAGRVMADTHFQSSDTNATLSATGNGNVYLRPNGYSTTTGQVHINTSGNATFAGSVIAGGGTQQGASGSVLKLSTSSGNTRVSVTSEATSILDFGNQADFDNGGILYDNVDKDMTFKTSANERMRITSSGKVGIGATDPLRKLHVVGNFAVNAATDEYYGVNITGGEGSNPTILIGDWHNSSANISWDSSSNFLRIDSQHSTSGAPIVFSGNDAAIEYGRFTATGNLGIGTTSPGGKLEVNVTDDGFDDIDVLRLKRTWATGSGTDRAHGILFNDLNSRMATIYADRTNSGSNYNSQLLFSVNSGASGTSMITPMVINNLGRVGIGTTIPSTKLHVSAASSNSQLTLERTGSATGKYGIYTNTNNLYINNVASSSFPLVILNNGNVGIGTTSPGYKLSVNGDIQIPQNEYIYFDNTAHYIRRGSSNVELQGFNGLDLRTNGSSRLFINQSGNVGIGTTNPENILHIQSPETTSTSNAYINIFGGHQAAGGSDNDGEAGLIFRHYAGSSTYYRAGAIISAREQNYSVTSLADSYLRFETAENNINSERMRITSGGNVGIGTTAPSTKLYVDSGESTFNRGNSAGTIATFRGQNTEKAVIATAQSYFLSNVGIGTTANTKIDLTGVDPRLHVVGDSTTGAYNLVASFQAGNDSNDTGAAIRIHHSNDRGLLIKAGRADSDREVAYLDLVSSGGTETNMLTLKKVGSAHNVGIGTTSPSKKFNIVGHSGTNVVQSIRNPNTSWGEYALTRYGTEGDDFRYMDFGYYRGANEAGRGLVVKSQANASLVTFLDSGNVGIGTTSPSEKLTVAGNVESQDTIILNYNNAGNKWQQLFDGSNGWNLRYYNGTSWSSNYVNVNTSGNATFSGNVTVEGALTETSARRFKENIKTLDSQISNISKLNPVSFDWKKDSKADIGFIAEEVKEVYPNLVSEEDGEIKGVQYTKLTAILVKALQDQQKQIDELKEEIFILKKK